MKPEEIEKTRRVIAQTQKGIDDARKAKGGSSNKMLTYCQNQLDLLKEVFEKEIVKSGV